MNVIPPFCCSIQSVPKPFHMMRDLHLVLTACMALVTGQLQAQGTCATAEAVAPGFYTVQAINGTEVPMPVCISGSTATATAGLWWSLTLPYDTTITVSTRLPQNGTVNTRVHVYAGSCGALVCLAGNDDFGGVQSQVTFPVLADQTYFIAFDDRWSAQGFDVWITEDTPAQPVTVAPSFYTMSVPVGGNVMAVVDMDNDDRDDVVGVSTSLISIAKQQAAGGFVASNITTTPAQFLASWSICAGDLDGNGWNDLLYGAGQGVTFMFSNVGGTAFTQVSGPEYVFSQRSNMVDINNDGHLDAFVCHDVAPNVYYMNDGSGSLLFTQGGLGPNGGNYGSIWTDYDNDGDPDLFVAKCGSSPPDVFMRNNGDGSFTDIASQFGLADSHQSWSSAWGDFDNDGDMDVLVGSSSSSYHKLMRNDDGILTLVTAGSGLDAFSGQSIEWVTHDFNNDGYLDILGGNGMLLGHGDMTFSTVTQGALPPNGPIGDLNNDGFLDVVSGSTAYLNNGNDNNWIKFSTQGVASNTNGIGARITIHTAAGEQIREVRSGDGFRYMSSLMVHFGLGWQTEVTQAVIEWPSGAVDVIPYPAVNTTLHVVEGSFGNTDVPTVAAKPTLLVNPNPVHDQLTIVGMEGQGNHLVTILNMGGQRMQALRAMNGRVDVTGLAPGMYVLELQDANGPHRIKFSKY